MPDLTEPQLVEAVARGDTVALGRLLQLHQKRLYNVALRMVGNRDDAAEVTQDAMVKVIEHVSDFKGQSNIGTWMVRIVMNLAISHLRKRKLRQTITLDGQTGHSSGFGGNNGQDPGSALRDQMADGREPNPAVSVQQREMHALLQIAMSRLDEDFRSVIVLRDIDELDYQQIAEALSVPVGTVKSRLFRARLALRHEMLRLCPPTAAETAASGGQQAGSPKESAHG